MSDIAIKLTEINKKYILHRQKPTLVENLFKFTRYEEMWALKDINLNIKKGERIGVIGNNGSGKTTLLKIITGITSPTSGEIKINGRIATIIGLEAGFHPELTGEENIYLNGMLLGMSKTEIRYQFDKIIEFSGIREYIDVPFYTYSSGMKLRLGFSIAIHSNPDILLIDEVLGIGDQEFQEKSYRAVTDLFKNGSTLVFVSHYFLDVVKICNKAIRLKEGKIISEGKCRKVIREYNKTLKGKRLSRPLF